MEICGKKDIGKIYFLYHHHIKWEVLKVNGGRTKKRLRVGIGVSLENSKKSQVFEFISFP
jgi:hypothetical protein